MNQHICSKELYQEKLQQNVKVIVDSDMILFLSSEKNKTMAELTTEEKSDVSHRGNAIKALNEFWSVKNNV